MLKVREIVDILEAEVLTGNENMDLEIYSGCGADLMSDVMAFVKESVILCTGLVNPQVVRTCEMMDIKVICFVRGKVPGENIISLAKEMGITILTTKHPPIIPDTHRYTPSTTKPRQSLKHHSPIVGKGVWD